MRKYVMFDDEQARQPIFDCKPSLDQSTIFFQNDNSGKAILKLCSNGDIFVKDRYVENDKEVVDALREFLIQQGIII